MTRPTINTLTRGVSAAAASTLSFSHTHSGNDLVVVVLWRDTAGSSPVVSDITYPFSSTPTSLAEKVFSFVSWAGDNYNCVAIWHTQNADVGSNTVSATLSEPVSVGDYIIAYAISFNDSDGIGTAVGSSSGNSSSFSATFTTEDANSMILAGLQTHNAHPITEGTGVTEEAEYEQASTEAWLGSKNATGGSDTIDASGGAGRYAMAAIEVLEAAGGGISIPVVQNHRLQQGSR